MKPMIADMTNDDRRWQAVCERDASADGQFVFAVLTTGVCCRPSCQFTAQRYGRMSAFMLMSKPQRPPEYRPL